MAHELTKRNPVNWFEIYVQDMERAGKFYETVLGVELQPMETDLPMHGFPGGPRRPRLHRGAGGISRACPRAATA